MPSPSGGRRVICKEGCGVPKSPDHIPWTLALDLKPSPRLRALCTFLRARRVAGGENPGKILDSWEKTHCRPLRGVPDGSERGFREPAAA